MKDRIEDCLHALDPTDLQEAKEEVIDVKSWCLVLSLIPMLMCVGTIGASGASRVQLTDERMMLVDGEPFFLIGLYDGMNHLGVEYSKTAPRFGNDQVDGMSGVLTEIAAIGFNTIRYIPWYGYQQIRDNRFLSMMNEHGLMAFTSIPYSNRETCPTIPPTFDQELNIFP
jgi:hypothetical protein